MSFGTSPAIYLSSEPALDLRDYVTSYLRQEVVAEASIRNLPAFSRFLEVAALCNATQLNFSAISNDAQVPRTTVHEYFEILQDTLLAHLLLPLSVAKNRKPIVTPKLYFFDVGVARAILGKLALRQHDTDFGAALESYIFHELRAYCDEQPTRTLNYWRTTSQHEVDFVLGNTIGIEVKASQNIGKNDLKSLRAFAEEVDATQLICVCREPRVRRVEGIDIWPTEHFLKQLWSNQLLRKSQ